jgi:hypothetical protein
MPETIFPLENKSLNASIAVVCIYVPEDTAANSNPAVWNRENWAVM